MTLVQSSFYPVPYDFCPVFPSQCLFVKPLNFSSQDLDLPAILVEVEKQGSSFGELLAIPEQDDWIYADGKSASCVAFVLEMYKEAGLFGPLTNSVQVTEFTVSLLRMFCYMFSVKKYMFTVFKSRPICSFLLFCAVSRQNTLMKLKIDGRRIF